MRTGLRVLAQGSPAWGLLRGEDARALFTGVAAHAISPMPSPVNSGAGLMLAPLAHTVGWPMPVGGSQAIPDALIADLRAHGGDWSLGEEITEPPDGVVIYDTAPTALLSIYGDAVPVAICKGVAALSIRPWRGEGRLRAVRRHPVARPAAGARADGAHGRNQSADGARRAGDRRGQRHAEWPMTLAALPHLADPSRIDEHGRRPLWTYAHVPSGSTADLTETVTAIFDRFAPGFRDLVLAARCVPAAQMSEHNANYVGGDIIVGGATLFAAIVGPTMRLNPWTTPDSEGYLCSSATPPGSGVHGMAGYYAARTVLRREFGIKTAAEAVAVTTRPGRTAVGAVRRRRTMNSRQASRPTASHPISSCRRARRAVRRGRARLRAGGEERRI